MKIYILLLAAVTTLLACSKNDHIEPTPIDYSQFKIKTIHSKRIIFTATGTISNTYIDTCNYNYSGANIDYEVRKSSGSISKYYLVRNGQLFTQEIFINGVALPQKNYYTLNSAGYVDSSWTAQGSSISNGGKAWHNADGTIARDIYHYNGYDNDNLFKHVDGNISYAIAVRNSFSPSVPNGRDSLVYEYFPTLINHGDTYNAGLPLFYFQKPSKNLVKKITLYDLLNSNSIRQTREFSYETDELGLVTKKTQAFFTQPGNIKFQSDTTFYTYYNR